MSATPTPTPTTTADVFRCAVAALQLSDNEEMRALVADRILDADLERCARLGAALLTLEAAHRAAVGGLEDWSLPVTDLIVAAWKEGER